MDWTPPADNESETSELELPSKNSPDVVYRPVRGRTSNRKRSHERTTGHEWRCLKCNTIVHEEALIGFDVEESIEQASSRHERIASAIARHQCPVVEKWKPEADGADEVEESEGDDE